MAVVVLSDSDSDIMEARTIMPSHYCLEDKVCVCVCQVSCESSETDEEFEDVMLRPYLDCYKFDLTLSCV